MSRTDGAAHSCVRANEEDLVAGLTLCDDPTKVTFAGRGLRVDTADDAAQFVAEIARNHKMKTLCLEGNTFSVAAAEQIGSALKDRPMLTRALFKDIFTTRLKTELPPALRHLTSGTCTHRLIECQLM